MASSVCTSWKQNICQASLLLPRFVNVQHEPTPADTGWVPADGWLGELKQLKTDLPYISLTPNLAYQINSELNLMVSVILY